MGGIQSITIKGVTMVELMIVLAIAAITMSVAFPSFTRMIAQRQSVTFRNTLTEALRFTKLQAIYLNKNVAICPSTSKISCDSNNEWNKGFIVFIDENGPGFGIGDQMLREWKGQDALAINNQGTAPPLIRYSARGMITHGAGKDIEFCHPNGKATRESVSLSFTVGVPEVSSSDQLGCE